MLEQGYFAPMFLVPRAIVERAVEIAAGNVFRLANLPFDDIRARAKALHLPGSAMILAAPLDGEAGRLLAEATSEHLQGRNIDAAVSPLRAVRRRVAKCGAGSTPRDRVSILIPTRNHDDLLRTCLESILPATARVKSEVIVVDNDSSDPRNVALSEAYRAGRRQRPESAGTVQFRPHRQWRGQRGERRFPVFLNNDVVACDTALARGDGLSSRRRDNRRGRAPNCSGRAACVQHGGVTLGVNFGCVHAFRDRMDGDPGYHGALEVAHETSAVTAACMMTRRSLFLELGGFDALRFPINFNDVDYCLRLRAKGLRVVFTPHASLVHHELASRGRELSPDSSRRFRRELWMARNKWGEALAADPFYSPLLALSDPPFSALAWPPRSLAPRLNRLPPAVEPPPGF